MKAAFRTIVMAAALMLAGCAKPPPEPVHPALWEVTAPQGQRGWLLGTIHALPDPVDWRSAPVNAALAGSDRLVMEIANADDPAALGRIYAGLAASPGLPPIEQRIDPALRPRLAQALARHHVDPASLDSIETWAVALTLSRAAQGAADSEYGLEDELLEAARGRPVAELEGAEPQLRLFDRLPEQDQRDLLAAVVDEALAPAGEDRLVQAWKRGDMAAMAAETRTGLLADPELRAALLTTRNADWAAKIAAMLAGGTRPLVAVGAAHMAGPEGLPALLAARGYAVRRIQ